MRNVDGWVSQQLQTERPRESHRVVPAADGPQGCRHSGRRVVAVGPGAAKRWTPAGSSRRLYAIGGAGYRFGGGRAGRPRGAPRTLRPFGTRGGRPFAAG